MSTLYKPSNETFSMLYVAGIIASLNLAYLFLLMGKPFLVPLALAGAITAIYLSNEIFKHYEQKKVRILSAYQRCTHGIKEYIEALKDEDGRLERDYCSAMTSITNSATDREAKIEAVNKYYSRMVEHNNKILCKL